MKTKDVKEANLIIDLLEKNGWKVTSIGETDKILEVRIEGFTKIDQLVYM